MKKLGLSGTPKLGLSGTQSSAYRERISPAKPQKCAVFRPLNNANRKSYGFFLTWAAPASADATRKSLHVTRRRTATRPRTTGAARRRP